MRPILLIHVTLLGLAHALAGCVESGSTGGNQLLKEASAREFGGSGNYGCEDTIGAAANFGMDYRKTVDAALAGNPDALQEMMNFSAYGHLDAASAQGHAAVMGSLLSSVGDRKFSSALDRATNRVRQAVGDDIEYDKYGGTDSEEEVCKLFNREFPRTYTLVRGARQAKLTTMPDR